jgi:HAD superfamily hydrolase (TIGR01509 family)
MIEWSGIDTVLLDMDGTLLDLHFDNYFWLHHLPERYASLKGVDPEQCRSQLKASYDRMRGTLDWYCLDYWSDTLDLDIVALKLEISHKIRLRPGAESFLAWLREADKKVMLVTNAHPHSVNLKMAQIPIVHHFDFVVSSHHFQAPKEQQQFWSALHQQHSFEPARTLFIDDTESVLTSAANFGVAHLLGVSQPDLEQPIRGEGLFPSFNHFDEIFKSQ